MREIKRGLAKLAQDPNATEVSQPAAGPAQPAPGPTPMPGAAPAAMPEQGGEGMAGQTMVTCLSDCQYAQNPEKVCMLKSVTLNMSKEGTFECGQYQAAPQLVEEQPLK